VINLIVPFSRPHMADNVRQNWARQHDKDARLIIVENGAALCSWGSPGNSETVIRYRGAPHQSFAKNEGLASLSPGDLVAIWDDDDYYGPGYIGRMADAFALGADVIGQREFAIEDASSDYFIGRTWHFHGPTIGFRVPKAAIEFAPCRGEEVLFLEELKELGYVEHELPAEPVEFVYNLTRNSASRTSESMMLRNLGARKMTE